MLVKDGNLSGRNLVKTLQVTALHADEYSYRHDAYTRPPEGSVFHPANPDEYLQTGLMRFLTFLKILLVAALAASGASLTAAPALSSPGGGTASGLSMSNSVRFAAATSASTVSPNTRTVFATAYHRNGQAMTGNVQLQYRKTAGWKTLKTLPLDNGRARLVRVPKSTSDYRWRYVPTGATTRTFSVAVRPATSQSSSTRFAAAVSSSSVFPGTKTTFATAYHRSGKAMTGNVQLQYKSGSTWKTLKTLPLVDGRAKFVRVPKTTSTYRWRSTSTGATTKSFRVTVKPHIALSTTASSVTKGGSVTLKGKYTRGGKVVTSGTVTLQYLSGSTWKNIRTVSVSQGTASTSVKPSSTTTYRMVASDANSSSVKVSVTGASVTYWVDSSVGLNARSGPGTSYSSLGMFANGTQLTHDPAKVQTGGGYTWRQVTGKIGGKTVTAWVADSYLTTVKPTPPPPATVPASFTLTGSGFGHGVGMSQFGAYQMAREGKNATQILQHYYTGTTVKNYASSKQYINVQLIGPGFTNQTATTRTVSFKNGATGTWRLVDKSGNILTGFSKRPTSQSVRLEVSGTNVKATLLDSSGKATTTTATASHIYVRWSGTSRFLSTGPASVATVQGSISSSRSGNYRHGQLIVTTSSKTLNIVNNLKFQTEYLYGIAEMPSGWGYNGGQAALQAQAITARTYAQNRLNSALNGTCNCHIVDTTQHQFFTGWDKENEGTAAYYGKKWKAAVDATRSSATTGLALFNGSTLSGSYYYSASGGRTANSEDVWESQVSYLRSVNDPYSLKAPGNSNASWTETVTQKTLKNIFTSLDDVKTVTVSATYSSGQVKSLTATSSTGQKQTLTAKADTWRSRLGTKAAWITKITAN